MESSRGWQMVIASLNREQQGHQELASLTEGKRRGFNVFDVDPDDPFDVDKKRTNKNKSERKQEQTMEMEDREEEISFPDDDDDYIPNSASDDSGSDDESVQSICVPMLSGFAQPDENETVSSTTEASAGNAIVETTADVNSSKDGNNLSGRRITRPCVYCGIYQTQLLRHLKRKHANEEAVKAAIGLPQQDRLNAFDRIRKIGMFEKNVQLQKEGGTLIRERRQGKEDNLTVCNGCKGFFNSKQIWRHKKNCLDAKGFSAGSFKFSDYVVSAQDLEVTEDFKNGILDCFRQDEVGGICRTDKMVIMIGQRLWAKSAKKEKHVIMSDMRLLANIIFAMRRIKQDDTLDGKGVLYRENFEILREAIQSLSTTEGGSLKAGMRLKIGYLMKKLIKVSKGHYIQTNEMVLAEETDRFACLWDLNWDFIFYTAQLHCEQRRNSLRKPQEMPVEGDLSKLRDFIVQEMATLVENNYKKWDVHDFILMRNLIVSRLTMFNARRGGEPARLTIKEWNDAKNDEWIDPQFVEQIDDPLEKSLLGQYKLAYQAGKGSKKLVPILIPHDTAVSLQKLVEEREECDIPESNPFVFPNTGGSNNHVIGWHSINKIVSMISDKLEKPSLLIADKFRHRVSTLFALLELPAEDRSKFYRHMGHSEEINKNVYQSPLALGEIIKVGGFLKSVDKSTLTQNLLSGMTEQLSTDMDMTDGINIRHPIETANEETLGVEQEQVSSSSSTACNHRMNIRQETKTVVDETLGVEQLEEVSASSSTKCSVPDSTKDSLTKRAEKQRRYQKWSVEDTKLVRHYFSEFIMNRSQGGVKGSLPGKNMVQEFLKQHRIFSDTSVTPDMLISLVKTKVFNERKKERSSKSFEML